jgi:hypothetical protein
MSAAVAPPLKASCMVGPGENRVGFDGVAASTLIAWWRPHGFRAMQAAAQALSSDDPGGLAFLLVGAILGRRKGTNIM